MTDETAIQNANTDESGPADAPRTETVAVTINGDSHTVPAGCSIADLLVHLRKDPRLLAVEQNQQLVSRKVHAETSVAAGDHIEIVTLVGGG